MEAVSGNEFLKARIRELSLPMQVRETGLSPGIEPLEGVRAVLFDVYGTLLMSGSGEVGTALESSSEAAMFAALAAAGCAPRENAGRRGVELMQHDIRAAHERMKAEGVDFPEINILETWEEILRSLKRENFVAADSDGVDLERLAVEYECRANPVWPMPGFPQVLSELMHKGMRLGIVSNAQFYTPLMIEALAGKSVEQLGFQRDLTVYSYSIRRAKPSSELFQRVLKPFRGNCSITPAETLYVGNDMLNDIQTAARNGCRTALFAGDARSLRLRDQNPPALNPQPDLIITSLMQLPGALI